MEAENWQNFAGHRHTGRLFIYLFIWLRSLPNILVNPFYSPNLLWRLNSFSLFWYLPLSGKYQYKEKPLKHQRRLRLPILLPLKLLMCCKQCRPYQMPNSGSTRTFTDAFMTDIRVLQLLEDITTLWTNLANNKLVIFFLLFPENRFWHFMKTICMMSKPVFWEK